MLEESRMDKKSSNRSSQPQSRASAIDCKKNTELTHKPWPRNNKKREGPSGAPKNEPYRKNVPAQRGRGAVDRRPRARGPTGFNVGGTQNTGIEDDNEPEIGSVFVPGSKKQNLNHLLNFMYPTRGGAERRGPQPQGRRPTQRERVVIRHEHDLYLRAYCQFVMKKGWDYNVNLLDPDIPVKWDQIEEIVVRSTGKSECPICLGTPVAGRVGLCGHVYCWPCVLHYAAAHDKQPPPCPVCTTPLHVKDMKPTRMVQWESPAEEVTMRLVRRLRGSTTVEIAPPRGQLDQPPAEPVQPLENINSAPYSKFFTATKQQVHEILERERKEIQNQILAEIDTTEIVFMEQVLEMLNNKEKYMDTEIDEPVEIETPDVSTTPIVYEKQEVNEKRMDWFDVTEDGAASMDVLQDQMAELDIAVDSNLNPEAPTFVGDLNDNQPEEFPLIDYSGPPNEEETIDDNPTVTDEDKQNQAKYFYFYQAEDGQQVFLNSLNVRILNASWGALAAAPPIIRGRVLHRETLPLTDQTRKHMPHTAHLPLYCSFDIVEMDLQPPYVTTTALKCFSEELERRARIRARHERDERRRERALRRAMEGPPKPDFTSDLVFPPAALSPPDPPLATPLEEASPTASAASPPTAGPSFAKMASTSGTWRVRKVTEAPPPPPADPNAPRALCLSDAIEAALHRAPSATPANGKKKKNKQKVLFATGMQRAG
ncbi:hypothetical protein ABMA28_014408 [Loxostege sticticalis]|uniref:E3 ubiquitin-protein ligase RNF10 n=1 Tax=Loxostege sticticalis TaxID=481309 RepID=A0ABD0TGP7_LOXSC